MPRREAAFSAPVSSINTMVPNKRMVSRFSILEVLAVAAITALFCLAAYERNRTWQDPLSLWTDTAAKSPMKARPGINRATSYFNMRSFGKARDEALRVLGIAPRLPFVSILLGDIYLKKGMTGEALRSYERALEIDPGNVDALIGRGWCSLDTDRPDDAAVAFSEALARKPDAVKAHIGLALAFSARGDAAAAIRQLRSAAVRAPGSAEIHNNLGILYNDAGMIDAAIGEFRRSIDLNPGSMEAWINLAAAYGSKGLSREAVGALRELVRIYPGNAAARFNLGVAYRDAGMVEEALGEFRAVLLIDPGDKGARDNLKQLMTEGSGR